MVQSVVTDSRSIDRFSRTRELSSRESNLGEPNWPSTARKLPHNAVGILSLSLSLSFRQTAFVIPSSDESRVSKARASRRDGAYKSNIREFHLNVTAALFRSIGELSRRRWGADRVVELRRFHSGAEARAEANRIFSL